MNCNTISWEFVLRNLVNFENNIISLVDAIKKIKGHSKKKIPVIYFTPRGEKFDQPMAEKFAEKTICFEYNEESCKCRITVFYWNVYDKEYKFWALQ